MSQCLWVRCQAQVSWSSAWGLSRLKSRCWLWSYLRLGPSLSSLVVVRTAFLVVVGGRSPFSCWLSVGESTILEVTLRHSSCAQCSTNRAVHSFTAGRRASLQVGRKDRQTDFNKMQCGHRSDDPIYLFKGAAIPTCSLGPAHPPGKTITQAVCPGDRNLGTISEFFPPKSADASASLRASNQEP